MSVRGSPRMVWRRSSATPFPTAPPTTIVYPPNVPSHQSSMREPMFARAHASCSCAPVVVQHFSKPLPAKKDKNEGPPTSLLPMYTSSEECAAVWRCLCAPSLMSHAPVCDDWRGRLRVRRWPAGAVDLAPPFPMCTCAVLSLSAKHDALACASAFVSSCALDSFGVCTTLASSLCLPLCLAGSIPRLAKRRIGAHTNEL